MKPNQDVEQLRLLSILHYVLAGIFALFSMLPIFHLAVGIAIVVGAFNDVDKGNPPPAFVGWFFIIIAGMFMLCGIAMAISIAIAGRRLGNNRSYLFCLVIAGIECMFMPIGTALGVFTIIVLMRPSVKELFGVAQISDP